ncbi:hypothetical protein [Cumulibacter soli]|uniref:hypothetical protein n=1 Tax=Cumulibacter soli TaxID=2546344 RepID=UPI001067BDC7|nr:hypothetical protein [Cumulibacter soli]
MTDPRDGQQPGSGQPQDSQFGQPGPTPEPPFSAPASGSPQDASAASPPTAPSGSSAQPGWTPPPAPPTGQGATNQEANQQNAGHEATTQAGEPEYFIHNTPPTSFQSAPDPFGSASGSETSSDEPGKGEKGGAKGWIIGIAAVLVVAIVAVGGYFLFFQSDDDTSAGDAPPSSAAERTDESDEAAESGGSPSSEAESSESSGQSESSPTAASPAIAGTYSVNGTIDSYSGPTTGQLGGTPRTEGAEAFTKPQTWTIEDCTDTTCELTVEESGLTITLELADGVWSGEGTDQIACTPTAGAMIDANYTVEIPEEGGTATRTMSADCDDAIEEVDSLTLEPK